MSFLKFQKQAFVLGTLFASLAFAGVSHAATSLKMAWDPSPESDVAGYKVHYGTSTGSYSTTIDAGANPTAQVSGLVEGNTYYFVVTAYNGVGLESPPSGEISHQVPVPPSFQITGFPSSKVVTKGATVTLSVSASGPKPLTYQWRKDNVVIPGAVGPTYTITNMSSSGIGAYSVVVSDGSASTTTPSAVVATVQMELPKRIVINGVSGSGYAISYKDNLSSSTWSLLTNVAAGSNAIDWVDGSATNAPYRFYQVKPNE